MSSWLQAYPTLDPNGNAIRRFQCWEPTDDNWVRRSTPEVLVKFSHKKVFQQHFRQLIRIQLLFSSNVSHTLGSPPQWQPVTTRILTILYTSGIPQTLGSQLSSWGSQLSSWGSQLSSWGSQPNSYPSRPNRGVLVTNSRKLGSPMASGVPKEAEGNLSHLRRFVWCWDVL